MGQCFYIFNLDKRYSGAGTGFGDWWPDTSDPKSLLLSTYIMPQTIKFREDPLQDEPFKLPQKSDPLRTSLCDLAAELHVAIFDELDNAVDVLAFSMTACHFWKLGILRFKELFASFARRKYQWAGDRFITLGGYAWDWPEGAFTTEEIQEFEDVHGLTKDISGPTPATIYEVLHTVSERFMDRNAAKWPSSYEFRWRCPLTDYDDSRPATPIPDSITDTSERGVWRRRSRAKSLIQLYKYNFEDWFETPELCFDVDFAQPCILRNLSKKVFVRADTLALDPEDVDGPFIKGMSFASLITARTAWSSDPSMGMTYEDYDENFHRGVWAGDRFDIVNASAIEGEEGWTDVSLEAKKELSAIWRSKYGDGWEDEIRRDL